MATRGMMPTCMNLVVVLTSTLSKDRPPSKDFHDSFALFIKSYKEYEFLIEY